MNIDKCEIPGCVNDATRIAGMSEGGIIEICDACWHKKYRS